MTYQIIQGKCEDLLKTIPDSTVQCCVTSPPYWQLKNYESEGQLGEEDTPESFVIKLANIFDDVKRVLKKDGVLWLNLGDTYCGGGGYCPNAPSNLLGSKQSKNRKTKAKSRPVPPGYKHKDLAGVPWMTALELRKRGWYLRSDIIWEKTTCMPEKVSDRPTRNHEYVFLLSKSNKYFYNADAIKEVAVGGGFKNKRSVWRIARGAYKGAHGAVFPEKLVVWCVLGGSRENDLVLDPFCGSGTTGKVAIQLKRGFIGIEINASFCEMAINRINNT
jgi:site-specific DNA-methyltransferase (cytosine-N4-specific)